MISKLISKTFNQELIQLPNLETVANLLGTSYYNFLLRNEYIKYSFPILCHETVLNIAKTFDELNITKIIELSCGTGWLTYWLCKYDIGVLKCVDNLTWENLKNNILPIVETQDSIECVKQNTSIELFILSWPYMDNVAHDVFRAMRKGQYLLYIGEGYGGCTANDEFFNLVYSYKELNVNIPLLQFKGIYDSIYLFQKEKNE